MEIPSLIIKDNQGRCSKCPDVRFIAEPGNEMGSLIEQFEAHCREAHPTKGQEAKQAAAR